MGYVTWVLLAALVLQRELGGIAQVGADDRCRQSNEETLFGTEVISDICVM